MIGHQPICATKPRLYVSGLCSDCAYPITNGLSYELWAVVRPDVGRHAAQDEQVCQGIDELCRVQLALHSDCQASPAVFIQDVERSERFPIIGSMMYEVI